jgi:hypothetical protein
MLSRIVAVILAVTAVLASAATAHATTAAEVVALLNAERAEHGFPADIVENPAWSEGCRLHMQYLIGNRFTDVPGGLSPHEENPGLPGATPLGGETGLNAQLARRSNQAKQTVAGIAWTRREGNPWEHAPFHLQGILDPNLTQVGYVDGCLRTGGEPRRAQPPNLVPYTYPANGRTIYPRQVVRENPAAPGDFVGLPQPRATGPALYLFLTGPDSAPVFVTGASLVGPQGPVDVRPVHAGVPGAADLLAPDVAMMIPARPLSPLATYTATMTVSRNGGSYTHTWSFRTGRTEVASTVRYARERYRYVRGRVRVVVQGGNAVGRRVRLRYGPGTVCSSGQNCQVRFTGRTHVRTVRLRRRTVIAIPWRRGEVAIRITAPPFVRGTSIVGPTDHGFSFG